MVHPTERDAFLSRQGPLKPHLWPYGNGFQLRWKAQLWGPTLRVDGDSPMACGFTHFIAQARTIDAVVRKALERESRERSNPLEHGSLEED